MFNIFNITSIPTYFVDIFDFHDDSYRPTLFWDLQQST